MGKALIFFLGFHVILSTLNWFLGLGSPNYFHILTLSKEDNRLWFPGKSRNPGSLLWGGWDGPGGPAVETPGVAPFGDPIKRRGTALAAL